MPVMVNWRRRGTRRSDVAPFVLIHGAYFGGWSWRWVVPNLRNAGHDVYAPSLTGVGERVHLAGPQVDLETHITDVVNLLHYEDVTGVVLVGWSYGGIIYFDADVPRDGDTSSPPSVHADKEAQARALGDGWRYPPPFGADDLPAELPAEIRQWMWERHTWDLLKTRILPIPLTGTGAAIPTAYIRCTIGYDPDSEINRREDVRIRSEPRWQYRELEASHAAPLTHPRAVADLLLELAAGEDRVRPAQS
jgi:pimeloyl-ACP methyl ester carboxylesterase